MTVKGTVEERVADLERERAIRHLLARYAQLADSERFDELCSLFTEYGVLELVGLSSAESSEAPRVARYEGPQGVRQFLSDGRDRLPPSFFGTTLHLIDLAILPVEIQADRAVVESYMVTVQGPTPDRGDAGIVGVSRNTWELVDIGGEWRIERCLRLRVGAKS